MENSESKEYAINDDQIRRLENNFTYHTPFGSQEERYQLLRRQTKALAHLYCRTAPDSRELSLALTNLEQAAFWANAAIARNEKKDGD